MSDIQRAAAKLITDALEITLARYFKISQPPTTENRITIIIWGLKHKTAIFYDPGIWIYIHDDVTQVRTALHTITPTPFRHKSFEHVDPEFPTNAVTYIVGIINIWLDQLNLSQQQE